MRSDFTADLDLMPAACGSPDLTQPSCDISVNVNAALQPSLARLSVMLPNYTCTSHHRVPISSLGLQTAGPLGFPKAHRLICTSSLYPRPTPLRSPIDMCCCRLANDIYFLSPRTTGAAPLRFCRLLHPFVAQLEV